jgi:Interferon-induced transmembrane protein
MSDYGSTPPPPPPEPPTSPQPFSAFGAQAPPPNYLVWAILSTVLCFLPLGVVSVVFATQVNGKWAMGDVAGAARASATAKVFAIWAAIVGAVLYGIVILLGLLLHGLTALTVS